MQSEYIKLDKVRKIDPKRVWYHGTSAEPFDEFRGSDAMGGTVSLASDFKTAQGWGHSRGGFFKEGDVGPEQRIIASRVDLPQKQVPVFTTINKDISNPEEEAEYWRQVHGDAREYSQQGEYPAYILDYRGDSGSRISDITVINPQDIKIASHDVQGRVSILPENHPAMRGGTTAAEYKPHAALADAYTLENRQKVKHEKLRATLTDRENNEYRAEVGDAVQIVRAAVQGDDTTMRLPASYRRSHGVVLNVWDLKDGRSNAKVVVSPDPYDNDDPNSVALIPLMDAKDLEPTDSNKLNEVIRGVESYVDAVQNKKAIEERDRSAEYRGIPQSPSYVPRSGRGQIRY